MKAYYFRRAVDGENYGGILLAPIYAMNQAMAELELPVRHSWCNASPSNCRLERVEEGTEWERICNSYNNSSDDSIDEDDDSDEERMSAKYDLNGRER